MVFGQNFAMCATIGLPDQLFRELKAVAAHRRTSLKALIRAAVEKEIRRTESKVGNGVKFPLLTSEQLGTLNLSNAGIEIFLPDVTYGWH